MSIYWFKLEQSESVWYTFTYGTFIYSSTYKLVHTYYKSRLNPTLLYLSFKELYIIFISNFKYPE